MHARLFDAKTCGELTDPLQYLAGGDWSHVKAWMSFAGKVVKVNTHAALDKKEIYGFWPLP